MSASLPVAVHVFLIDREKKMVLLLKRANTGFLDGFWSVPAWRLEEWESASVGAKRELFEEVWVKTRYGNWASPLIMHHKNDKGERIYFFFTCYRWSGVPINSEQEKCDQIKWFSLNKLPKNMIPHVRFALKKMISSKNWGWYFEYGFEE